MPLLKRSMWMTSLSMRDVTTMWCSCAFDLSQSTDCQWERARASSGLHSWLRLWCSEICQDRSAGRIQISLLSNSKTRPDEHHNLEVQSKIVVVPKDLHSPSEQSPSTKLQYFGCMCCPHLISRVLLKTFVIIFHLEQSHETTIKIINRPKLRKMIFRNNQHPCRGLGQSSEWTPPNCAGPTTKFNASFLVDVVWKMSWPICVGAYSFRPICAW